MSNQNIKNSEKRIIFLEGLIVEGIVGSDLVLSVNEYVLNDMNKYEKKLKKRLEKIYSEKKIKERVIYYTPQYSQMH